MKFITAVFVLLGTATIAHAQTPCPTTPPTGMSLNPNIIEASLPEQNTVQNDGTPLITDYQIAYFAQGANVATATPLLGPFTVPKTAFTLITGTVDCYTTPVPAPLPQGTQIFVAAAKSRRAATATLPAIESPWGSVTNPFASAPTALVAPGLRRAR